MSKKGSTQVQAPDPVATANAQAAANSATAAEQQRLNLINSYGPDGSVVYKADPSAPGGYSQTTSLSPGQQQLYDQSNAAQNAALGIANQQIGRVGQALGQTLNADGLPALSGGVTPGAVQSSFDMGRPLQYTFNQGPAVQTSVGGNLDTARQQAIDATYNQATSRLDPRFQKAETSLDAKLANQGLGINSAAYQNAQDTFGREKTDAYNQAQYSAIGAGEDAANSLFNRQLGQGQFANSAAGQIYGQNLGAAQFYNQTAGQDFNQNLNAAQFANQAQNQGYNQAIGNAQFGNEARNQGLQERAYIQNQPLNQFNSLMSSGQVSTPQGIQYSPTQVGQTDVLGAYALNQQAQQANANRAAQAGSGLMGGLFSLGSAALMSDMRLKKNIQRVGKLKPGIDLYSYEYLWGGGSRVGVLAQEVAAVNPAAIVNVDGFMAVKYGAI